MLSLITLLALRATLAAGAVDLTARRAPVVGLPDWSKAGYNSGSGKLPTDSDVGKTLGPDELASKYGVVPDDGKDDSDGLERAISEMSMGSSNSGGSQFALIQLPAGVINLSRTVYVDANRLILRGAGNDPENGGTVIQFAPDELTKYDVLEPAGDRWSQEGMSTEWTYSTADGKVVDGAASSGWLWPGRSVFRVGSKGVAPKFEQPLKLAPNNRKDIFYGSVNYHWRNDTSIKGFMAAQDMEIVGKIGTSKIYYDSNNTSWQWQNGDDVWVAAPARFVDFEAWGVQNQSKYSNEYMYQDWFTVQSAGRDDLGAFLNLDHDLRFDVYANSSSGGSQVVGNRFTPTKVMPIEQPVTHIGIENLYITQPMSNLQVEHTVNNYGNLAPESAMHGVVFRYARDCWMRGVRTYMTGSHPIATEAARFLQIQDNVFDGAWNKGAGGNGYVRGSRVWDSLYFNNTLRNLRHFTFQWSAMGNVALFNDMTNDLNLHGGWEGFNLVELNKINVPYEHRAQNCDENCGGEGTNPSDEDSETWAPIYWSAGDKAAAWSGATGPRNVFYRNEMKKAFKQGAPQEDYSPYTATGSGTATVWQFGWDRNTTTGSQYVALSLDGKAPMLDWSSHERTAFDKDPALGVNARLEDACGSLFLKDASPLTGVTSDGDCAKKIEDVRDGNNAGAPGARVAPWLWTVGAVAVGVALV